MNIYIQQHRHRSNLYVTAVRLLVVKHIFFTPGTVPGINIHLTCTFEMMCEKICWTPGEWPAARKSLTGSPSRIGSGDEKGEASSYCRMHGSSGDGFRIYGCRRSTCQVRSTDGPESFQQMLKMRGAVRSLQLQPALLAVDVHAKPLL